nr:hypothetical protein [Sebaldella termitidis]
MIVELYIQEKTKKYLSQEYGVSSNTIREWLKREKKEIKEKYKDETSYLETVIKSLYINLLRMEKVTTVRFYKF